MKIVSGVPTGALLFIWLSILAGARASETNQVLFVEHFDHGLAGRWQQVKFLGLTPTVYSLARDGTNDCLLAAATNANSAFMTKLNLKPPAHLVVSWRWKIDQTPPGASEFAQ